MVYVSDMVESVFFFPFNHNRCYFVAPLSLGIFSFRRRVGSKLGVFFLSLSLSLFFFFFFFFCYLPFRPNNLGAFLFLEEPPQPNSCSHVGHNPTYPLQSCYSFLSWFVPLEPCLFLPLSFVAFRCLLLLFVAFRSWTSHSHAQRVRLAPPLDCDVREGKGGGAKS